MHITLNKDTENVIGAIRAGYGGEFQDGALGDRRWFPFIKPLEANPELGIPEPKEVVAYESVEGRIQAMKLLKTETTNYVVVPVLMLQALMSAAPDKINVEIQSTEAAQSESISVNNPLSDSLRNAVREFSASEDGESIVV